MAEPLDMRHVTYEQAARAVEALVTGRFLEDFSGMIYAGARTGEADGVLGTAWVLEWRSKPTLRIQVRADEPKLLQIIARVLGALHYEVRDKNDHLVVIL